jgi:hypothetical protein
MGLMRNYEGGVNEEPSIDDYPGFPDRSLSTNPGQSADKNSIADVTCFVEPVSGIGFIPSYIQKDIKAARKR